jgi:hypothetical protein
MIKGFLFIGIGVVMLVFDATIEPVFRIPITSSFSFPLGFLAGLVGALWVVSARAAVVEAQLTQAEVATWGDKLERSTPRIIALSEQQCSTEYIAELVHKEAGIPEEILIKYMYAMRTYLQQSAEELRAEERRQK